jgi:hypothetical protein
MGHLGDTFGGIFSEWQQKSDNGIGLDVQLNQELLPISDPDINGSTSVYFDLTRLTTAAAKGLNSYGLAIARALVDLAAIAERDPSGDFRAILTDLREPSQRLTVTQLPEIANRGLLALRAEFNALEPARSEATYAQWKFEQLHKAMAEPNLARFMKQEWLDAAAQEAEPLKERYLAAVAAAADQFQVRRRELVDILISAQGEFLEAASRALEGRTVEPPPRFFPDYSIIDAVIDPQRFRKEQDVVPQQPEEVQAQPPEEPAAEGAAPDKTGSDSYFPKRARDRIMSRPNFVPSSAQKKFSGDSAILVSAQEPHQGSRRRRNRAGHCA